ncbi:MAG: hypothetical protein PHE53_06050 [Thermoguttaceae bacterium]|nr:hypothetical protein [Thermoguttaceae bacterium]
MARREESQDAGYDSFLDVVSNIVGILIILVMVVGIRVGKLPLPTTSPDATTSETNTPSSVPEGLLSPQKLEQTAMTQENGHLARQITTLQQPSQTYQHEILQQQTALERHQAAIAAKRQQRQSVETEQQQLRQTQEVLSRQLAQLDTEIASLTSPASSMTETTESQQKLEIAQRQRTGLQRTLYELRIDQQQIDSQLQTATMELAKLTATNPDTPTSTSTASPAVHSITLESYPTPIGRTVSGPERHYRLRGGRIATVPIDALTQQVVESAKSQIHKLSDRAVPLDLSGIGENQAMSEFADTVGPIDGFRMRYVLRRTEQTVQTSEGTRRAIGAELAQWTVIPVFGEQGETLEQIFEPNSKFMQSLTDVQPDHCTLTFWIYADSFEQFHAIRKWAHEHGWSVAARPLPDNYPISGSPEGSRSEAI